MNLAVKIQQSLGNKTDLRTIKKVISLYEKIKNESDDFFSAGEAIKEMDKLISEVTVAEKIKAFRSREGITQKKQ